MALNPLTLDITSGIAGQRFQATVIGLSAGSTVEVGSDGTPGFSFVNGRVTNDRLPPQNPVTLVLRETLAGSGYRDSRIAIAVDGLALGAAGLPGALGALGVSVPDPYLGAVGCRGAFCDTPVTDRQCMSRAIEFARDDIVGFFIVDSNFTVSGVAEVPVPNPVTLRRTVRYKGANVRVRWNGSDTGTMPAGAAFFISDFIPIPMSRGDMYGLDVWGAPPSGGVMPFSNFFYAAGGDQTSFGQTTTDLTGQEWTGTGGSPLAYRHAAIIAVTRRPTWFLQGDSRYDCINDTGGVPFWWQGAAAALHENYGVINASRATQTIATFVDGTNGQRRIQYAQWASHLGVFGATNDLAAGSTAAQVVALRQQVRAMAPGLVAWEDTVYPRVTGTYDTLGGQTPVASEAQRIAFNALVRGGATGFANFFDTADAIESSRDSGLYGVIANGNGEAATALSSDGVHLNKAGAPRAANGMRTKLQYVRRGTVL